MKRAGRVFEQLISFGALHDAAYRALCTNRENGAAPRFMYDLEPGKPGTRGMGSRQEAFGPAAARRLAVRGRNAGILPALSGNEGTGCPLVPTLPRGNADSQDTIKADIARAGLCIPTEDRGNEGHVRHVACRIRHDGPSPALDVYWETRL